MRTHLVLAGLSVFCIGATTGAPETATAPSDDSISLIGTWRLVVADDRPDENSQWRHSYGDHPKGYLVYDATGHMFVQFCTDPSTPPFKAGDFNPTAREAKVAYLNYAAYFGTYSIDPVRHVVTHHVEGSLMPGYANTDQERPYQLRGDHLELSDGKTWRRVWMRVPPPNNRWRGP